MAHFNRRLRIVPLQSRNLRCRLSQNYFGSGSGSTVLTPGRIVDVALNFR